MIYIHIFQFQGELTLALYYIQNSYTYQQRGTMVLWEITLGTAYFLGLKRTYKLALRIQRRLVGPKRPKIRQFLQRKTRSIFDVALKVHREVQQRDIEVGRNLGNWILRWLDKMKPAAQIRSHPNSHSHPNSNSHSHSNSKSNNNNNNNNNSNPQKTSTKSYSTNSFHHKPTPMSNETRNNKHLFTSRKTWHSPYPSIGMMMRPQIGINTTHYRRFQLDGVIRNDIMQWMMMNN
ncbi:hypothetical protein Lser_V15G30718 [Lactuca serriola]